MELPLYSAEYNGDGYHVVTGGKHVVVLNDRYNLDQLWMTFDNEIVIFRAPHPVLVPYHKRVSEHKLRDKRRKPRGADALPYIPAHGDRQYPLPMVEWQIPSPHLMQTIAAAGHPLFDRDRNSGDLLHLRYSDGSNKKHTNPVLRGWITEHCDGRVLISNQIVTFEKETDYIIAKVSGIFSTP